MSIWDRSDKTWKLSMIGWKVILWRTIHATSVNQTLVSLQVHCCGVRYKGQNTMNTNQDRRPRLTEQDRGYPFCLQQGTPIKLSLEKIRKYNYWFQWHKQICCFLSKKGRKVSGRRWGMRTKIIKGRSKQQQKTSLFDNKKRDHALDQLDTCSPNDWL